MLLHALYNICQPHLTCVHPLYITHLLKWTPFLPCYTIWPRFIQSLPSRTLYQRVQCSPTTPFGMQTNRPLPPLIVYKSTTPTVFIRVYDFYVVSNPVAIGTGHGSPIVFGTRLIVRESATHMYLQISSVYNVITKLYGGRYRACWLHPAPYIPLSAFVHCVSSQRAPVQGSGSPFVDMLSPQVIPGRGKAWKDVELPCKHKVLTRSPRSS